MFVKQQLASKVVGIVMSMLNLLHKQDTDIYGDYMSKHKDATEKSMPVGNMKCRNAKESGE